MNTTPSHRLGPTPRSSAFERWAKFVLRLRWLIVPATLTFSGWMGVQVSRGLVVDTRNELFVPSLSAEAVAMAAHREAFGSGETLQVVVEGPVFTPEFLKELGEIRDDLTQLAAVHPAGRTSRVADNWEDRSEDWEHDRYPAFLRTVSILDVDRLVTREDGAALARWARPPFTAGRVAEFRREILAQPSLVGQVVDPKGRRAVITLQPRALSSEQLAELWHAVSELANLYDGPGFRVTVGGLPAVDAALREGVLSDQNFLLSAVGVVLLILMWWQLRHTRDVLGPLLVVAQAALTTFGWMALVGAPLTLIGGVLGALVLCVGIGNALHVQYAFRRARFFGLDTQAAVVHAVATNGVPSLFATLATCVGMLGFGLATMEPIRQLGLAAGVGIFSGGFYAFTFLPAWLALGRRAGSPDVNSERGLLPRLLEQCNRLSARVRLRRLSILAIAGALACVAAVGSSFVQVHHDPLAWLPEDAPVVRAVRRMDEHVEGSSSISLLITAHEGASVFEPQILHGLARVLEGAVEFREPGGQASLVADARSLLDPLRQGYAYLLPEQSAQQGLPQKAGEVTDLLTFWSSLDPHRFEEFVTFDARTTQAELRVKWRHAAAYGVFGEYLDRLSEQHLGEAAHVQISGGVYLMFSVVRALLSDLMRSIGMSLALVALMMLLLLREVRLGLIALVPSAWPILGVLGYMGFSGRALDIQNVLLAPLIMGIAIHDSVHFLHAFRVHFEGYGDVDAAVEYSFHHAGRSVARGSLVLMAGFAVLNLAYLGSTREFGLLAVLAVGLALLANVVLIPALLRTRYRSRPRAYDSEIASSYDLTLSEFV